MGLHRLLFILLATASYVMQDSLGGKDEVSAPDGNRANHSSTIDRPVIPKKMSGYIPLWLADKGQPSQNQSGPIQTYPSHPGLTSEGNITYVELRKGKNGFELPMDAEGTQDGYGGNTWPGSSGNGNGGSGMTNPGGNGNGGNTWPGTSGNGNGVGDMSNPGGNGNGGNTWPGTSGNGNGGSGMTNPGGNGNGGNTWPGTSGNGNGGNTWPGTSGNGNGGNTWPGSSGNDNGGNQWPGPFGNGNGGNQWPGPFGNGNGGNTWPSSSGNGNGGNQWQNQVGGGGCNSWPSGSGTNDASCWGPSDSAPWGDRRSGGSPNSRKEFGKISVVNFSLPLDWVVHVESGHGNSSAKFLKYLEIILNYAIHTQASSEGNHESLDGKYVDIVSKFDPIKCSAVLNESKSNQKPLKSKGGETCLAHRKKIVGVCQCPPVPMGECCHRDKRLYVRKVPAKYVKFPVDVTVRFPSISLWLQQRWPQVLRSAESRLKSGIHDDLFKDASIIAE